jgi:hypothetical protein
MYDALVSDGAQIGTRQQFKKLMLAPGKEGYRNRLGFYQAMKQDGANIGDTYEDFGRALGLHAVKPQRKTKPVAQKPMTTAQRAMQVPHRLKTQLGKAPKSAPKGASPFVQSLYEIDEAQKGAGYPVDYTSPKATQQVYQRNQRIRRQAAKTAAKKISRQASHAQPIMQTNTPADTYIGKTEGQLMDEMNQSANALVGSEMGDYLDKVIGDEFKAAHARGLAALSANSGVHGTGGADWWIGERAYQNQMDQDKQLQEITGNIQKNIESIFSNPKVKQRVLSDAQKLGVSPETYIESSLAPALIEKAGKQFNNTQLNRMMAKGASDYIASGILNSLTGTLLTGLTSTKSQRQMQQQADAMTEEGLNPNYKPGTWAKAAKGAVAFAADAPLYNLAGVGAGALTEKVFGNAAQQMARVANQSLRQRVFEGVARGIVHGGATGFQYGAINGAVQNYSTGEDTSLWGTLKAAAKGGLEEGVSFATMEGMGGAVGAFGHGIGLKGTENTWKQRVNKMGQKLTYEGIKTGMEGIGMATGGVASSYANHILTGDDWHGFSTEGTLESCASAVIFKLTHAKDLFKKETDRNGKPFSFTSNIAQKTARFFLSGEAKSAPHVFSDEEKHQLFAAGSELGMKPMENIVSWAKRAKKYRAEDIEKSEDGSDLLNNYQQIMLDPNVSWDAKAKFTTMVMGTMPESRPMMDHISYGTEDGTDGDNRIHTYKTVNEYAADGTLLSKHRFDTKDKRESIIYEIGVRKEELRSKNALALLVGLDRNNYDLQNSFFKKNAKDWEQVQEIVEGMQTGGSKIDHQFTEYVLNSERGSFLPIVDAVANKNGMDRESVLKAFYKDPMKRTDEEQNACVQLRKAIEMEVFPANKVHEEQSVMDGKDVATDNNLGTEQPNGGAVKAELDGLRQAEAGMDELMRDNDVFGQNFQKLKQQGLTNPQIYDWMVQQGGLTVEQLEPFAHYINANARVQGMQEATKNAIDEQVSSYVQDWSFHGTLNGQEKNGEQAIYVQDSNGRTLLVGTGEVAFDTTTGRAKEGVGDMLVCLDPKSGETVYVKSDEVKFVGTQSADDFANGYRQELQMKNSEPYNQAAQEQAMQDAAKPQPVEKSKDDATKGGDLTKDDTTLTKVDTTSGKDNTTSEDLVPQEQPQPTRKFADGSDVPMTKDSKGRPTPDYEKMTPEQSAEILTEDFGENAEKVVDGQIQKAEKALKDAERIKVDYTAEPNDIMEQEALKKKTVEAAKKQLEHAQNIKKTMTAKKVTETVGNTEQTEGAHEAGSVAAQKFENAPRLVGNKRTRMLPDGETKIKGHYEIVPAESLTPSHDVNNGYKKSEGFPTDAEGRTVNDRDYEHDKAAQQNTDQIARKYNGMAIEQVPVVSDEGIVYDGNGRTMAGQKAAKEGTDGEYINDLLENAENFGFTREQIEQSGIEHPRLIMVTDERLPYDTATFSKFNRNEKKTQSNTEQAVAKAKTLTSDEVGAIVAEIEGSGSLDAFFNNSKAINDLVKTLVDKGIIGQNEVAQMMDSPERLSAQGREYVKNLLLGSIFKPETIRMLGIDSAVKNKAVNVIRSVMDNMKLGDYSLRDEIDQAIQLLYEARQGGNKVDTLLRTPDMFGEDAAKRYSSISQMMALALEGKVSDFRDLLDEYNRIAASRNTGEGNMFEAAPTKEELINEYLNFKKWQDYGTGHSENEGGNDVSGIQEPKQETSEGNGSAGEGAEPERPRVEEPDDLVNKELESRIKVTDEETETPSENGPITRQKILIDSDKEVIKVDEPNDKGEYTGSYYEYDGKKFGDLNEVVEYVDGKVKEKPLPLLPREEKTDPQFNPIEAAAAEFKKEHPLTEEEIMKSDLDDLSKDMALDYLNGEVTDDLHRAIYESIYAKRKELNAEPKVGTSKTEPSANPMEEIKNAAEGFEKEKKTKIEQGEKPQQKADDAAVSASNKKVNDLWKELMNAGKDEVSSSFIGLNSRQLEVLPKLVSAMAENAYLRIKRGMHNLEDVVKEMRKEFAPAAKIFKKEDVDAIYEQMMNIRYRDGEQRMSLKDWADYYEKTSPKHQENLVGDSKNAEERKQKENSFINRIQTVLSMGEFKTGIAGMRKIAEDCGLEGAKDTDLQELVETAVVGMARRYASSKAMSDDVKFAKIKLLYNRQPSLNQRDSERVMKQQYSTPAPYAYLADVYVKGNGKEIKSALEPSAGNGMLTIGLPKDAVHVNDIDAQRLENLRRQGFKNVTSQDGTQPFADKDVDVVVTNPPFGSATPKEYDGYKISSLEGQMAINALESMKDDGRAAIIIGGKTEYAKNGSLNPKDKAFLGYLYSHYNVEDVINVDGSLYAKQGTSYPTRIILINGRRLDENAFPPVKDKARAETVKDYDELYKRIEDDILRGERMDSSIGGETRSTQPELDKQGAAGTPKERVRAGERGGSKPDGEREPDLFDSTSVSGTHDDLENQRGTEPRKDGRLSDGDSRTDGTGTEPSTSKEPTTGTNEQRGNGSGGAGRNDAQPSTDESASTGSGSGPRGQLQRVDKSVRGLSTEKVTYTPKSGNPFTLKAVMPADQQEAVNKNLEKLGDADQFLVDELGYNDKDDLYSHLAAEQVDSVALALQQAKKGNAFIIGDMTGIGKGRQAASLIRYAKKQGQVPVYFTKTAGLLSDVYRDLVDIGSPDLRPFVFGSAKEAAITDSDGKVVFALPSKSEVKRVLDYIEKNGKLPDEYDYVLTTYSQVSNGVYEFDENGARKEKKLAKGKTFGAAALSGQRRRDAIEKLMDNAYLILDESHTAGGNSGQGNYFQHIIQKAKNVTFFSATFAKRPDNMPIYALRTAMNEGGMKSSDLIDAVKRGGATLQEIMSQTLTQCGQMIRRERDMTGVTIDWKAIDDPERVQEQREQYDSIIGLFNDIINFQKKYVSSYVDERNEELAAIQSTIGIKKGTAALGIKNQPFASKAFNTVQQVLLSLKAKSAAERAIDYLKQGMKPVIALNNTNESQTGNLALGEEMDAPDLGTSLKKGLEGTLRYTQKDAKDNSESGYIKLSDLGDEAVEAYHELEKKIEQTSTGLSLSPIDVIKNELQKAGYKVGELTGRQTEFVYNDNGTVTKVKRADTDKKKLAREFNDGQIDALILNKSAATGISLHASSKYKDQKKRVMIVAQQQLDVNDEVQMRGRIDRTGQVARGAYEYVVSLIPAEQRLLMMFKAKLKSLDANTTSSQKSKFNEMDVADITNKYGDKVVREYMAEHLDLYSRMADPFGWEKVYGEDLSSIDPQKLMATASGMNGDSEAGADASKLLGRMALLRVNEQEKMLQEIGELYANEIQRLNEMGENDLEITELPLKAKTLHKEVWKQGAEPGGDNAFADNTYIEKVNMAILKKPMKAAEVKAAQDGLTGGKTWDEYKKEKKKAIEDYFINKAKEEGAKIEDRARKKAAKAREKYLKDALRNQKDSGMTDEQIAQMAIYQQDSIYKVENEKGEEVVKNLKAKAEMFYRILETFNTEDAFVLPTDMNNPAELSGFGNSYGRLIDIKITDNFSPNASTVSFATLDGRRKITFPINGKVGIGSDKADVIGIIDRLTRQASAMGDKHLRVLSMDAANWDKLTSNESRKDGYIVTGNLMQALVDSKDQGLGGQLVKYTTDTGEVKTGILMPDRFDPKGLTTDAPINSVADKFELSSWHGGIDEVTSSDGEVKVKRIDNYRGYYFELRVPKSKAKGGKYFMDEDLLKLVDGNNFETRGNNMLAEFKPEQLKPVLDRLSKMGVKVQEERKTSEDEGTHFREEDPQEIELSKDEYAVLAHTIDSSHKNYKRGKVNYEYTADNFYVFKYNKYNDYNVYQKIPIDGNEELINYIKNGINKETIRNPRDIDSALEAGWDGRNGHYWDSTSNQEGRGGSVRPGEVSSLRSRHGRPSDERMGEELSDSPSSAVNNHIERIAQKTGGKVKMVSSVDEITNKAAKAAIEEGRNITGWYDEKTGEVCLYMPNIHDRYTAEKTIWHEVVGHKGMRELFGEERFEKFLRDVWYDLDKPENAALKKLVDEERKFNPMNIYDAIEEGIARLAEDGKGEAGFWNGIKNKVSDFLHEIGYRIAPNTKDVKYLLWLSKNLQKNPNDPYWKLRAEAVKYRLDHEDIRSVVSRDGVFYENDGKARSLADLPKADYQEATDGQIHFRTTPTAATALDRYHRSLDEHGYMATESYMDNMLSLKKLMNAIVPDKKVEDIASSENPYILQNVMQGAMSDASKMFEINIMSPLEKAMAGVLDAFEGKKTDDKIRNFNLYMITKHGLERNRVLFVRDAVRKLRMDDSTKADAEKLQSEWGAKKEDLGNQLKSGIIDLKRYYEKMDEWIRDNVNKDYEAGEHDYSGMHGVQDIISMKDPYNDGEAIQSVMDSEAKMESVKAGSVRDYWDKVRAATRYSVDSDYNNGIIDRDLHGHVSKMFDWYVPLRNYDETTAEDVYGYITEIGDPKNRIGSTLAKARGHKYLSETNILAQIGALGNRAIKNGGDNAIKQAFARFARNHSDNNLIKETSVWYVKDPTTGIVEERYPDIPEGATADEINQIVSDFDTDMAMLKAQGLATKKFDRGNIGYRFERAKDKSQHIVDVMIAGKKHSFVILGNPRAAQALNGMLEHKNESLAGRTTAAISRFMAQTCTSYNPEFVMRNMIRDFEFASTNLLAKEGMAYTKTFEKYYAQVGLIEGIRNTKLSDFKKMTGFGLFSKYRNGTLDTSDKIQRYFKEFMENGGETGWVQIKNMKDLTAEYKLHVKTEKNGKARVSKNVFDFIFKNLENANEVAENLARFATYCASRDAGRSTVRSAYDAKEVSVNFNRHGSGNAIYSFKNGEMSNGKTARKNVYGFWASWFRNSSMFFNAGVQSTNLLIKNFKNNKAGTIGYIMAGPMMSGMAMALINNMLIASEDEKDRKGVKDPYGELPDYIRRNNLCIYVGGGEFITIPLAIEERAFYGLGDLAAGLTFSKNISGQKNPALDAVGCMSQLVPVADYLGNASFGKNPGEETIKAIAPSATSPIFEWFFNSDWKGAPIHRENKFDENQPSWMLAYKGTPEWLININKKANAWSNDVAPGNENMKGNDFLDAATDPSLLQHLYSSYLGGAATFMERVGGLVKKGKDTETKDIPFVRSLFYTPSEQTSLQRTKSKWYNYLDETEKMIANAKRLKSKKVPLDELVKNYGDYYKFKQSKGAEKMNVIEKATKEMKKWKELRNKSNDAESINFANQNIDYIMMRAVNELDKLN